MSADPLEVHAPGEADANLYGYVDGRVLQATDADGLAAFAAAFLVRFVAPAAISAAVDAGAQLATKPVSEFSWKSVGVAAAAGAASGGTDKLLQAAKLGRVAFAAAAAATDAAVGAVSHWAANAVEGNGTTGAGLAAAGVGGALGGEFGRRFVGPVLKGLTQRLSATGRLLSAQADVANRQADAALSKELAALPVPGVKSGPDEFDAAARAYDVAAERAMTAKGVLTETTEHPNLAAAGGALLGKATETNLERALRDAVRQEPPSQSSQSSQPDQSPNRDSASIELEF